MQREFARLPIAAVDVIDLQSVEHAADFTATAKQFDQLGMAALRGANIPQILRAPSLSANLLNDVVKRRHSSGVLQGTLNCCQVINKTGESRRRVSKQPECGVAAVAQHAAHYAGHVVVVDMRIGQLAQATNATAALSCDQIVEALERYPEADR